MRAFFDFIARYSAVFVFLLLTIVSSIMLFSGNSYQQAVYLTSSGRVVSTIYSASHGVTGYFHLRSVNDDLNQRLADLELENANLRRALQDASERLYADTVTIAPPLDQYRFIVARVINNSLVHPQNYITINRGAADGITPEMGVVDQNGVVGIVDVVGPYASRVISLLNSDLRLSCKVKGSDAFGSLVWDGKSPQYAVLEELPRHVPFAPGDTIVTSGYSVVFPEGIPVGTIVEQHRDADDNFYSLKIRLTTDFATLSTVHLIENFQKQELEELGNP